MLASENGSNSSLAESLRNLPPNDRDALLAQIGDEQARELLYDWTFWARPSQLPPDGKWRTWLLLAGRGFGKTRTGAEYVRAAIEQGKARYIALVAPTAADARDVMVEGESGLLSISPPWNRPLYEPSKRRLSWPNGARATLYSADEPERLRGPQHDLAWCDELASWRYPEAWDMLMFGLRLGSDPRVVVTTTPKPTKIVKELVKSATTAVTRGSSYDNRANLAPAFFDQIVKRYEGTRLGRQELYAEILTDVEGALWKLDDIEKARVQQAPKNYRRIVVAIDPAVTAEEGSDETGIIVAGIGLDGRGYVLADLSGRYSPREWALRAVAAYEKHGADRIIAEVNNGGDLVEATLRTVRPGISYKAVHASRGKTTRAEPVAALYEKGMVSHVGMFPVLEDQLTQWTFGDSSPDRLDALVWALSELMLGVSNDIAVRSGIRRW